MLPLEPKRNLCTIMEYAILDTANLNREIECLRGTKNFTEGKNLLIKIKNVIMANTSLIRIIDNYIFNMKGQKVNELGLIRWELIKNLRQSCLDQLEPSQEDVQRNKDLRLHMRLKYREIFALWKKSIEIEKLIENLLAKLDDAIALQDAIAFDLFGAQDWEDELIKLEKPKRKLSRSC